MSELKKKRRKRGAIALLATGAVVGLGVGAKLVKDRVAAQREAKREEAHLQELENEQFEEDYE